MGEESRVDHPYLQEVAHLHIGDEAKKRAMVNKIFFTTIKKRPFSALFLTITTLGIYLIALRKKARRTIENALAARKINYYNSLMEQIETIRSTHPCHEPREDINNICKQVMLSKANDELSYQQVFTSSDLYLLITTPPKDEEIDTKALVTSDRDYVTSWMRIKKKVRSNEFLYIKNINKHYTLLTSRHKLSAKEIHERLSRTSVAKNSPHALTKLKNLGRAFDELSKAYKEYEELGKKEPQITESLEEFMDGAKPSRDLFTLLSLPLILPADKLDLLREAKELTE